MANTLTIKDRDTLLEISYEDMIKYHGRYFIGGVALAYKILEFAFSQLLPGQVPSREKLGFLTGLGIAGMGVIDGVEMVTRAKSRGTLITDLADISTKPGLEAPGGGKYYFEVDYDGRKIGLAVKEGLIPMEFIDLSRQAHNQGLNPSEAVRLQNLKENLATALMSSKAEELFEIYW